MKKNNTMHPLLEKVYSPEQMDINELTQALAIAQDYLKDSHE